MTAAPYLIDQLRALGQHDLADDVIATAADYDPAEDALFAADDAYSRDRDAAERDDD